MSIYCMICWSKSNEAELCTPFFTHYFTISSVLQTDQNAINYQVFLIVILGKPNRSYPSMVAHHLMTWVFKNFPENNPFFWNWYILTVKCIEVAQWVAALYKWLIYRNGHLKVGFSPCVICLIESPLMKNVFYFISKALFVLKIFKFLPLLFDHVEETAWLERSG